MTRLLEQAFAAASKLSEAQQNAIAVMILQEIALQQPTRSSEESDASANSQISTELGYPAPEISAYMERQAEIFEQKKAELLKQYHGMYILFEEGQVLDADESEEALVLRAFAETGPRHLFVKQVIPQEPELSIHGFLPHQFIKGQR